ncbi:hypothetical protein BpHYR1_015229 [Brachionus plicatilis]|uniref:Uncharacterized protein n=1 Tax=Brachionus plicatilis TaxID=10195 RepID=A0A3M7RB86_BRAPC|nr:hypothetical protein BpHYR1_015229 [Brachionus plicatilis]
MVPTSKDYLEKLSVQELVNLIKTQNGFFENEFQKLDDDSELVSCTEAEQMEWLQMFKRSEEGAKSILQDVLRGNLGFGLRETRIINFKVDDIPKLYGNDRDKVDEWIYLVETYKKRQHNEIPDNIKKIDKIDEFELVWFFLEALDPKKLLSNFLRRYLFSPKRTNRFLFKKN